MQLEILFEDKDIIVCYKPSSVATQTKKFGEQDMESALKNYLKGGYVAVIHRLDQPVEGILVFAKTPFAAKELNKGLQGAGFGKHYQAVLCGKPQQEKGTLEDYLIKDGRTNTSKVSNAKDKDAKKAVLHYEVLKYEEINHQNLALVKVQLETGRHHQIRVQMANMGCPIWGDGKYNTKSMPEGRSFQIALCAYRLEFTHPRSKERLTFEIEPRGQGFSLIS